MIPDERESLTTGHRSLNAKNEKPFHVSEHQPHVMNMNWPMLGIQKAKRVEVIAPAIPRLYLTVKSHERNICTVIEKAAKNAMRMFLLWAWRNIWLVNETMKENIIPIAQREMVPATRAMLSSCPNIFKIGVMKKNRGRRRTEVQNKTIHDLWRYTPIMLYSFAPYACPHRVSNALAIPNYNHQFISQILGCIILHLTTHFQNFIGIT